MLSWPRRPHAASPNRADQSPRPPDRRARSRGQSLVEFTLVVVFVLLPLLMVGIDFGRVFFSYIQASNAAREAAAYGATNPTDTAGMTSNALQETNAQNQRGENPISLSTECRNTASNPIDCSAAAGGSGAGNTLVVTVTEEFTFFTPFINGFFDDNFNVAVSASTAVLGTAATPGGGGGAGNCSPPSLATFAVSWPDAAHPLAGYFDSSDSLPNSGICAISGYNWDFGDGTTDVGYAAGVGHTFPAEGSYTVNLEVTNQAGSTFLSKVVVVGPTPTPSPTPTPTAGPTATPGPTPTPTPTPVVCQKPTARFTYTSSGKTYQFTDLSSVNSPTCPITTWFWEFGDGETVTNSINPVHTYGSANQHTVTLTVTNLAGSSSWSSKQ